MLRDVWWIFIVEAVAIYLLVKLVRRDYRKANKKAHATDQDKHEPSKNTIIQ